MKTNIKLIALDLDGTLLTSSKELTQRNINALRRAADAGIEIVPTTGRYYSNMPEAVRNLDFVNYAITINGAYIYDIKNDACIARAEMPVELSLEIMEFLDKYPVCYGSYIENKGYITRSLQEHAADYTTGYYVKALQTAFQPVESLKDFVREFNRPVQKTQFFMNDFETKEALGRLISEKFRNIAVSSSVRQNIEINDIHANKGEAILRLCEHLGIDGNATMAFGDGGNDMSMISTVGCGVAMGNAVESLKKIAARIAPSCDEDGVAVVVEELLSAAK